MELKILNISLYLSTLKPWYELAISWRDIASGTLVSFEALYFTHLTVCFDRNVQQLL